MDMSVKGGGEGPSNLSAIRVFFLDGEKDAECSETYLEDFKVICIFISKSYVLDHAESIDIKIKNLLTPSICRRPQKKLLPYGRGVRKF